MDAAGTFLADTLTFHILASFPYTTAILFTLLLWMCSRSVLFNSSATKPIKELSGVCAARRQCQGKVVNEDSAVLQTEQNHIIHCFLAIIIIIDFFKRNCHQLKKFQCQVET